MNSLIKDKIYDLISTSYVKLDYCLLKQKSVYKIKQRINNQIIQIKTR